MEDRISVLIANDTATIETYVDGSGPALIVLPYYGRDGGKDYDNFTASVVSAGFSVLRPQPRGIGKSTGLMENVSMEDQVNDIVAVIRKLGKGQATVLGHAYGHMVAKALACTRPGFVSGVVLAAAQASKYPEAVGQAPAIAGDPSQSEDVRLKTLKFAFFAPLNDARAWLDG